MTPLQINRAIAKLKYDHVISRSQSVDVSCWNESWLAEFRLSDVKNWAESIADAWELFEEMVYYYGGLISVKLEGNSMPMSGWPKYKIVFDENHAHVRNKEFSGASTAPLAICLAWLEWNKQTKGE